VVDLLDLARLDAGTLELQHEAIDLPGLLNNIAERFGLQAQGAGVTLHVEAASLPTVMGDGDRLAQVFTNLVDNAIKNTPAGGQITIRSSQADPEVQVEVEDSGNGIPPEALAHIFERFYQADPSRPGGNKHGTGLGLAIVKEIVNAHGGKISVRSKWQPVLDGNGVSGSTFTVILPLTAPELDTAVSKRKK